MKGIIKILFSSIITMLYLFGINISVSANTDINANLIFEKEQYYTNEEVKLRLVLTNIPNGSRTNAAEFKVIYDTNKVKINSDADIKDTYLPFTVKVNNSQDGVVTATYFDTNFNENVGLPLKNGESVLEITFTIKPGVNGDLEFKISDETNIFSPDNIVYGIIKQSKNVSLFNEKSPSKENKVDQPNQSNPEKQQNENDSVIKENAPNNSETNEQDISNDSFTDTKSHWASKDIEFLASKKLISGTSATTFSPNKEVTRAEFTALLVRLLNMDYSQGLTEPFADIQSTDWYYNVVITAYNAKLVAGKDAAHFLPNAKISREEMAVMVIRAIEFAEKHAKNIQQPAQKELKFLDNEMISSWAKDGVQKATKYGIVSGRSANTFAPKANASRAESAVMIKRMYALLQAK